jgi:N-methylhydantoinase B
MFLRDRNGKIEPYSVGILSKKLEMVVNRIFNTLLRSGRSVVLNTARGFSCSIADWNSRLITVGEGLPIHAGSSGLIAKVMTDFFDDIRPGDAFLKNSPYYGNTHHADHAISARVFYEGIQLFTAIARAHQADVGNSLPTTYAPYARDIYEEGALDFPCVRIQRDYKDVKDVTRMANE